MNNSFLFPYDSIPGVLIYDEKRFRVGKIY